MSESKQQKETSADTLELDKQTILEAISKNGAYHKEGCNIRRWEGSDETDSFICDITNGKNSFIGVLNGKFDREGYGMNTFENGDRYLGYFEDDKREKRKSSNGMLLWILERKQKRPPWYLPVDE